MSNAIKPALDELKIDRSERRPHSRGTGWIILLLLLGAGGWFVFKRQSAAVVVKTVPVMEETSASVGNGASATTVLNASGYVTARRQATVSSKTTGKIVEVLIEEGMDVKEGQLLAKLDTTNLDRSFHLAEAQLESTKAAIAETKVQLAEAKREQRRTQQLAEQKIASASDLDAADAQANALAARLSAQEADVEVAKRQVALYRQQLDDLEIRAPFTGVVVTKNAQPGEMISPLSAGGAFTRTGICTIVDMNSLEIEVDVNEAFINRVEAGQVVTATLDAYPDWKIPGKVIAIIPTADRQKATVKVRIGFDHLDPRILPEMGIKVAFQEPSPEKGKVSEPTRRLTIPAAALRNNGGSDVVFVLDDGHARLRSIKVSGRENDKVMVESGLSAGERVIINGPENLTDGQKVKERAS